jgi:predicted N-formylglutamate amidohydrolase
MNLHLDKTISPADDRDSRAFTRIAGSAGAGFLLLCDHASNRVPAAFDNLGLPAAELARHIAFDPGAAAVTLALATRLSAPAVMSDFSRLVIDPNRGEDDPTLIMKLSDRVVVPANKDVSDRERANRIARFHAPYHSAIALCIDEAVATGVVPALVSIHSFTPVWRGRSRPWQVGILWDRDPRLARPLISALAEDPALTVGDNEPYEGALINDTLYRHGTRRGLAHALVEIRQDLIADDAGAGAWADRLAAILLTQSKHAEMHEIRHYGSRTGPVDPM